MLKHLRVQKPELSITFVNDSSIRRLNKTYRKKDKPTDVLSFTMDEKGFLGDIIISLDTATRQAQEEGISLRQRLMTLIIHGVLHLLGYDHVKDKEWKIMSRHEARLLSLVK